MELLLPLRLLQSLTRVVKSWRNKPLFMARSDSISGFPDLTIAAVISAAAAAYCFCSFLLSLDQST